MPTLEKDLSFVVRLWCVFLCRDGAFLYPQQNRDLVRFSASTLLAACQHLISCSGINTVFPRELLNRFSLLVKPGLGLCRGTDCGHSSKPFK